MTEGLSERPSFTEAFAADVTPAAASLPADTPTASPTTADAAPATEAPVGLETQAGDTTPIEGPVPYARFKEINESKKQLEESLNRLKWAETVDRTEYEAGARIGQMYRQDRAGFFRQVLAEAGADPQVRSELARALGTRAQPVAQVEAPIEPDIPVMDDQGRVVSQAFSADRVKQYVTRAVAEALQREVSPLRQTVESVEAERQALAQRQQVETSATAAYTTATAWPHFKTHEAAIATAFQAHPEWTLQGAYIAVVVPKLQAQEQAATLDDLTTKAAARTVNPSAASVATTQRPRSLTDARLQW